MKIHTSGIKVRKWTERIVEGVDHNGAFFFAVPKHDCYGNIYFMYNGDRYYRKDFLSEPPVINKMLSLSIRHLSQQTLSFLDEQDSSEDIPSIYLFKKQTHRYFIPLFRQPEDQNWPDDLLKVIRFAESHSCKWIMLDVDGPIYEELSLLNDGSTM